jgi:hypothetical protein
MFSDVLAINFIIGQLREFYQATRFKPLLYPVDFIRALLIHDQQ